MSKVEKIKSAFATSAMLATAIALSACAGNTAAPATDVPNAEAPDATATSGNAGASTQTAGASTQNAASATTQATAANAANATGSATTADAQSTLFISNSLDSYRLATPESKFADGNTTQTGATASAIGENQPQQSDATATNAIDPYQAFPALAESVFAHADSLYTAGQTDEATAYLERFRIIKPLWSTWESRADSMLNVFGKARAEKSKQFEPLVLQIQNMNRAQAAYSMVAESADSLIALAPGDSLVNWANAQKQTAYKNTFAKAQKEYAQIKSLGDDKAQFSEALAQAEKLQMRYRDFEEQLHIQALIDHLREMAESADPEAIKYWEKNDPAEALKKADALAKAEKFAEAKELLTKLKASKLRKEAGAAYQKLADAFCNKQRKETSQIFAKAQKQKDSTKKQELLQKAMAPLDKCLAEFPENSQKQKVVENRQFLEKELAK